MKISERVKNDAIITNLSDVPKYINGKLNIEITSLCNEKCIYCFYSAKGIHKIKKEINPDFFYRITKEAFDLGIREAGLYIKGEPFMNPNLYDYVSYLKKTGYDYVYISTNGLLCNKENFIKLANAGIDSVKFSISAGNRESFLRHHGVDGFDIVYKNIVDSSHCNNDFGGKVKLYTFSVLTKFNFQEKDLIKKLFEDYVDEVFFLNVQDDIIRMKGLQEYLAVDGKQSFSAGDRKMPCPQLFNRVVVDEEGYLCSCCYSHENLTRIIDLKNCNLTDGLYCDEYTSLRRQHMEGRLENNICKRCIYNEEGKIEPLTDKYSFESVDLPYMDNEAGILKRFNITKP